MLNVEGKMVKEYVNWLREQVLPHRCAEEMLHEEITPTQRTWISQFIIRWDAMIAREVA